MHQDGGFEVKTSFDEKFAEFKSGLQETLLKIYLNAL